MRAGRQPRRHPRRDRGDNRLTVAPQLDIRIEEDGARGRYVTEFEGQTAVLDFVRDGDERRVALHVGVPRPIEGRGVGQALVRRMVEDARAEGFRIVPRCPFVAVQRRRHRDWEDAFA